MIKLGNINKIGIVLGIVFVAFFLICTVYGGLFADVALKELHLQIVQLMYPGFAFTAIGYLIGTVEAFVYGWILGALFVWLHNKICCENKTQ